MDFFEYDEAAAKTAIYPKDRELEYLVLGLASEAGEVAGFVKKIIRDDKPWVASDLLDEIGDVLWYISLLCQSLGLPTEYVAHRNIEKLQSRQDRGVLSGSGDNR